MTTLARLNELHGTRVDYTKNWYDWIDEITAAWPRIAKVLEAVEELLEEEDKLVPGDWCNTSHLLAAWAEFEEGNKA